MKKNWKNDICFFCFWFSENRKNNNEKTFFFPACFDANNIKMDLGDLPKWLFILRRILSYFFPKLWENYYVLDCIDCQKKRKFFPFLKLNYSWFRAQNEDILVFITIFSVWILKTKPQQLIVQVVTFELTIFNTNDAISVVTDCGKWFDVILWF